MTSTAPGSSPAFAFGQPDGAIIQVAYTVDDIERAMADYGARLKVGPWFVLGPFMPPNSRFRGQPCAMQVTLAFAFAGHVQIELLQQHNDVPSALRERPLGFHHWGIGTRHFEAELAQRQALGHEVIFTDQAPDGARFAYVDTLGPLPGYIEFIEMTPGQEAIFTMMQQASVGWDGTDPVRRIPMGPAAPGP